MDFSHVRTDQMSLNRPNCGDLDELHALYVDPEVWKHNPTLRHTNPAQTADHLERLQHSWNQVGLGSWCPRTTSRVGLGTA